MSGRVSKFVDPDVRHDIHMEPEILPVVISTEAMVSGRVSKVVDPDVRRGIQMEPEILPVVLSTDDVEPMAVPVVALTRSRLERTLVVARPVDEILSGRESNVGMSDVSRDICMEPDLLPVVMSTDDVEPLAMPVVTLTRSQVERPLVVAWPVDDVLSGRESNIGMSDVSRDICMEPDLLPVVMSTDDVEPLAVPVVALMRPQVEGPLDVAWPVNEDAISRAAVYPDLLSGRVMKSVDPDVRSGDPLSLKTIPGVDGDALEMVFDDVVMEKFVLIPEVCLVAMTSAAGPTFLPALSELYSPVFLAGG